MVENKKLQDLIQPVLSKKGIILYTLEFNKKDRILSVLIEREDGSMDLNTCVEVSNELSNLLDLHDPIEGEYILEVASPGTDRFLKTIDDYKKAINKYIALNLNDGSSIEGYLRSIENDELTIEYTLKTQKKYIKINLSIIKDAKTTVKI